MSMDNPRKENDNIAAIATGLGGSICIIRTSGKNIIKVVDKVWQPNAPLDRMSERRLILGKIVNEKGDIEDHCMAVYMPGPNSYTGEDVVEFHCHGGQLVARIVLALLLKNGVRHAEPGEFTKRAFLNGKIDLTQAEAVLDVIQSQSEVALHAANRQLNGILSHRVSALYESLTTILAEIEVRMDFSDEELDWDSTDKLSFSILEVLQQLEQLQKCRENGEILRNGVTLVIVGIPNAGKSSLMNYILGRNRAIVTDIPGTTRDTLEELAQIRGIPVRLVDTAGLRESDDPIEREGVARTMSSVAVAQLVLWVIDSTRCIGEQQLNSGLFENKSVIAVANKSDIVDNVNFGKNLESYPLVRLSAKTGEGINSLYDAIEKLVWRYGKVTEPEVAINARHSALLANATRYLSDARSILRSEEYELVAVSLRSAIEALGKITGKTIQPDILDNIFSKFCIGK